MFYYNKQIVWPGPTEANDCKDSLKFGSYSKLVAILNLQSLLNNNNVLVFFLARGGEYLKCMLNLFNSFCQSYFYYFENDLSK